MLDLDDECSRGFAIFRLREISDEIVRLRSCEQTPSVAVTIQELEDERKRIQKECFIVV